MKRALLVSFVILFASQTFSQLLSWSPAFVQETSSSVIITMDATKGNQGLFNYTPTTDVYVHIGVITNLSTSSSNWLYVSSVWGTTNPTYRATYIGNNKWTYTITGGLRSFFGLTNPAETIKKIAILFRSGNGNSKQTNSNGGDMFVPVYDNGLYARIDNPFRKPEYVPVAESITKTVGDVLPIVANASLTGSNLQIYFNGNLLSTVTGTRDSTSAVITSFGAQTIVAKATNGVNTNSDTLSFFIAAANTIAPLPAGVKDGINYYPSSDSATLVLYAPSKNHITVLGDFNNWLSSAAYQMSETPDGLRYWITLKGLTSGTEYAYQYLIDDSIQVADFNTEKVLDKNVDPSVSATTYPGLKTFPVKAAGTLAGIIQTGQAAYNWQVTNFSRPDKRNLVIYELLVRDFVAAGNWQTLKDTLNYLKKLGINAIEVMPFSNFEGASSWGYNPNFYFAPDKVYGTPTALKQFIDACHQQGMAVIMDMVLNHSFGSSPMVQMYWDAANGIPAANSPWFEQHYTHAFDVGYQFKNASQATADFRQRVVAYWLNNYHIDGYRFDLAKGFTPTNTCDASGNNCNVGTWGNYDANRVAIWETIYNQQQSVSPNSYCILEMFADNSEQQVEANYGMLLWGTNMNSNFNQATMGYSNPSWDFSAGIYSSLGGWNQPGLVTYQESHDEERLMWKNEQYGNSNGSTYNIKDTATGLQRNAMAAAFWAMIPGPKMLWQFEELGYDYSINTCADGVTINTNCRLDPKPIKWNYLQNANRRALHDIYSSLLKLRTTPAYFSTFTTGTISYSLSAAFKWMEVYDNSLKVVVVGNFDVTSQTGSVSFPSSGTWYDYLNGTTITATGAAQSITLQPGEYHVYLNANIALPVTLINFSGKNVGHDNLLNWSVGTEENLNYYELERSEDGQNFIGISQIAATGKSGYAYTDDISAGTTSVYYYRLKSVDKDGNFKLSAVIKIKILLNGNFAAVNPNPFKNNLQVTIQSQANDKAILILTDLSGRQLLKQTKTVFAGNNQFQISEAGKLASGTYMLTVIESQQTQSIKVVKGDY
ncbi:MAG: alpha-amylase family glycosyl hydrolase [Ginsengibacter sp.]